MYDQIFNILSDTYGRGAMVEWLAEQVQKLLEKDGLTDKTKLTNLIWDWMPGGDTAAAAYVADRLLALEAANFLQYRVI